MHQTSYSAHGEFMGVCNCFAQIGGSEFLHGFKDVNWNRGCQDERQQPDTWTPFCTLGCESCGEHSCHGCVNSTSLNMPVKQGRTFREESNICSGEGHQTAVDAGKLVRLVRLRKKCGNSQRKGGGFILKHPENWSGIGMSSHSMPKLLSQLARKLSDKVMTSGLKPLDRLDVECSS